MSNILIQVCKNKLEAEAREKIIRNSNPGVNWNSKIVEGVSFITSAYVPDVTQDGIDGPMIYPNQAPNPPTPAAVLMMWSL